MPRYEITGPGGKRYEINAPEGASQDEVLAYAQKQFGGQSAPAPKRGWMDDVTGALSQLNSQIPLADELAGAADTATNIVRGRAPVRNIFADPGGAMQDIGAAYDQSMGRIRGQEAGFQEARPHAAALARGTGMAAGVAIPAGKTANLFAESPRIVNAARGAVTAGLTAAGYAAADRGTPAERLKAASEAAMNPVVLGLGAAGGAMAPAAKSTPRRAPVTVDNMRARTGEAYRAAEEAGAQYSAQGFGKMVGNIERETMASRLNPMRHPKAASMLEELQALKAGETAPTLTELDQLRQVIRRDVANSRDDAEAYFGRMMIDEIDKFIGSAGAREMAAGAGPEAAGLISAARDANTRYRKVEAVTDAVDRAKLRAGSAGSGGNVDNAIRQNLRGVLEKSRNLTDEERAALESIVVGGKVQNTLRLIGKLSPQGNGLMLGGQLLAAIPTKGASVVAAGAGAVSKVAADRMTQQKVQQLLQVMAEGGTPQARAEALTEFSALAARDPAVAQLQKEIAAQLSKAAGVVGRPQPQPARVENIYARP